MPPRSMDSGSVGPSGSGSNSYSSYSQLLRTIMQHQAQSQPVPAAALGPTPLPARRTTVVTFSPRTRIYPSLALADMTDDEIDARWTSSADERSSRADMIQTITAMRAGRLEDEGLTYRGLEHVQSSEMAAHQTALKNSVIDAVLDEQDRHFSENPDPVQASANPADARSARERIAAVGRKHSSYAVKAARERAEEDARCVLRILEAEEEKAEEADQQGLEEAKTTTSSSSGSGNLPTTRKDELDDILREALSVDLSLTARGIGTDAGAAPPGMTVLRRAISAPVQAPTKPDQGQHEQEQRRRRTNSVYY